MRERLARAAAKPAADRTYDDAALLRAHALLDAAKAHVAAAERGADPGVPHVLLAALCSLGALEALCSVIGAQPGVGMAALASVLARLTPQLEETVVGSTHRVRLDGPPAAAAVAADLLSVALFECAPSFCPPPLDPPLWSGLDALHAARDGLFRAGAAAALGADLAALQQVSRLNASF